MTWLRVRLQFQIQTLLALVLVTAVAIAAVQAWQRESPPRPRPTERFVADVLAARAARPAAGSHVSVDPIVLGSILGVALLIRVRARPSVGSTAV